MPFRVRGLPASNSGAKEWWARTEPVPTIIPTRAANAANFVLITNLQPNRATRGRILVPIAYCPESNRNCQLIDANRTGLEPFSLVCSTEAAETLRNSG